MSPSLPLPHPDDDAEELRAFLTPAQIQLYRILYERRDAPPNDVELRAAWEAATGTPHSQLDRRRRDLYIFFHIEQVKGEGSAPRYRLTGRKPEPESRRVGISERVRAEVLRPGRCAMCGRTPLEHGVVLQIDHKVPVSWGGHATDTDNLQPLCEECNRGKKADFESFDELGPAFAKAVAHEEVHRRLGAFLLLAYPGEVRSDLLELVANFNDHQEDWQKRLREMRELGWDYTTRKERDGTGKVWSYYRLKQRYVLPDGNLRARIRQSERAKKAAKRAGS